MVEGEGRLPHLIIASVCKGSDFFDIPVGNSLQARRHAVQGPGHDARNEIPDEQGQRQAEQGRYRECADAKSVCGLVGAGEGNLHADGPEHRARGHGVASQAVLAQVIFQGDRRQNGPQPLRSVRGVKDLITGLARCQH